MRSKPISPPTLSVVVPIYGVEEWLPAFLDSLIAQTRTDWEAILVIDGSPDRCQAIAEAYAAGDERMTVHVFENGGIGRARNRGLALTTGEYVTFPDPDDLLKPDAFELLLGSLVQSGSDIATGAGEDFVGGGATTTYWAQRSTLFDRERTGITLRSDPTLVTDHVAWNKVFRTALLRDNAILYPEDTLCEDVVHSFRALSAAAAVDVVPDMIYRHRRRAMAITADIMGTRILDDWMTQLEDALGLILRFDDEAVTREFLRRFLTVEVWSRLANFHKIEGNDRWARFEEFARRAVELTPPDLLDELPPLKSAGLRFLAKGGISARWRVAGFGLSPISDGVGAPSVTSQIVARSINRLDLNNALERQLAALLVRERILVPMLDQGELWAESTIRSVVDSLNLIPNELTPYAEQFAPRQVRLIRAALAFDYSEVRWLIQDEKAVQSAVVTRLSAFGSGFLLSGEGLGTSTATSFELVLRSRTSRKVRTVQASVWKTGKEGQLHWRAVLKNSPEYRDEEWCAWIRTRRGATPGKEARLDLGEPLLTASSSITTVDDGLLVVLAEREFVFLILTQPGITTDDPNASPRISGERATECVGKENVAKRQPRVLVFPYWSDNPYLNMLYLDARSRGARVDGVRYFDDLIDQLERSVDGDVFHLHWTSPISDFPDTEREAKDRVARFSAALAKAQARGMKVVWTLHNKLPHDAKYPELARELHVYLARVADTVHVIAMGTTEAVSDSFALDPATVVRVPHSSYLGVYGQATPRRSAREHFGIADAERAILFFGQVRPYKGLDNLLGALEVVAAEDPNYVLLMAGKTSEEDLRVVDQKLPKNVRVIRQHTFVPDEEVSLWFSAADRAVFPYENVLNSGSVHLAATYGLPSVLPDEPHLRAQFGDAAWVRFFDKANPVASIASVLREWNGDEMNDRAAAIAFARSYTPFAMSAEFSGSILVPLSPGIFAISASV